MKVHRLVGSVLLALLFSGISLANCTFRELPMALTARGARRSE